MRAAGYLAERVGRSGVNRQSDVQLAQELLNKFSIVTKASLLREDGVCGDRTISAIVTFQRKIVGLRHPDGIISPLGPTWQLLCGQNAVCNVNKSRRAVAPPTFAPGQLQKDDFEAAAKRMGPDIAPLLIAAFAKVESGGKSGFGPEQLPVIAFEGHWFRRYTQHKYDVTHPTLSYPYKVKAGPEWKANNKDQKTAWKTLRTAAALDHDAALKACSWGMFQVMGFNYADCGYKTVDDFVNAMKAGEKGQLEAFVGYCIKKRGMLKAMAADDFVAMATLYNGEDYGDYDKRIAKALKHLKDKP